MISAGINSNATVTQMQSMVFCQTPFWFTSFQLYSFRLTCILWWCFREIWWSACLHSSANCCSHSLHHLRHGWWVSGCLFLGCTTVFQGVPICSHKILYQSTVFFVWPGFLFDLAVGTGISQLQFANMNLTRNIFVVGFSLFMGLSVPQYFNEFATRAGHGPVNTDARWVRNIFYFCNNTSYAC